MKIVHIFLAKYERNTYLCTEITSELFADACIWGEIIGENYSKDREKDLKAGYDG